MNCLCCGKKINSENKSGWHVACIKRFFGTKDFPKIDLTNVNLESLVVESTNKGYTIPGVQKKISLHLNTDNKESRLTLVNYPTGYILKPSVEEFDSMPEAEHLVMSMADAVNIITVPHALVLINDTYAYITKRIDRVINKENVEKLAMEDFCQLDRKLTKDKYLGSYERCGKIIEKYSFRSKLDLTELFIRVVFCYITGNSDMHLKNFSLIETSVGNKEYVISPAYDLLPVQVIMPEDKEDCALAINGKKTNIRKNDFFALASNLDISKEVAQKLIKQLVDKKNMLLSMCSQSLLPDYMKERFANLIEKRCAVLTS